MPLTTRKASAGAPPLIVAIPMGWRVIAGKGAAPTAADINHGWHPASIRAAIGILHDGYTTMRAARQAAR